MIFWIKHQTGSASLMGLLMMLILVLMLVVGLLLGAVRTFFNPAITAAIPDIVPKEKIAAANSLNQSSVQISTIFGQGLGGYLLAGLTPLGLGGVVADLTGRNIPLIYGVCGTICCVCVHCLFEFFFG